MWAEFRSVKISIMTGFLVLLVTVCLSGCGSESGHGSQENSLVYNTGAYLQSCSVASESTCYDYGADETPNYAQNDCESLQGVFSATTVCPTANRVGSCSYIYYTQAIRYYSTGEMPWTTERASGCNTGVFSPN